MNEKNNYTYNYSYFNNIFSNSYIFIYNLLGDDITKIN